MLDVSGDLDFEFLLAIIIRLPKFQGGYYHAFDLRVGVGFQF
jgi:hypothetical protein